MIEKRGSMQISDIEKMAYSIIERNDIMYTRITFPL